MNGNAQSASDSQNLERLQTRLDAIPNRQNRTTVASFVYEEVNRVTASTVHSRLDAIIPLGKHLGDRAWEDATREDVIQTITGHTFQQGRHLSDLNTDQAERGLAASTKYQWGIHLRVFFQWLLEEDGIPPQCRRLPFPKADALATRARELALAPQEVRSLLSGASTVRDRFVILFLVETGFRAGEAAAIRLDGVEQRNHGYWIKLPENAPGLKTGPREVAVPVIAGASAMEAWLAEHPRRHEASAPLLVTLSNRSFGRPMTAKTVSDIVVRSARRAGMRHIHGHMLRHTSATLKIAKGMESEVIRLIHGWSKQSTMLSYYAHVKPHFERMVLEAHGLDSDEPELVDILGSQSCNLCGEPNPIDRATCTACGVRLSEAAQESERRHQQDMLLGYVAQGALESLQGTLMTAVARAMGWTSEVDG